VAKWKPVRVKQRRQAPPGGRGRLISCLLLLVTGLVLFFLLFSLALQR